METARQAISYHRFSTKPQAEGDSDRRYYAMADRICKEKGWILSEAEALKFHDAGKSGFHGANIAKGGDLARFLSLIQRQGPDGIIAGPVKPGMILILESLDRLSRLNPWDAFQIIQQIVNAGVWIYTGFGKKTFNPETVRDGTVSLSYIDSVLTVAHEESQKKSERAKAAWETKHAEAATKVITTATAGLPQWIKYNPVMKELELTPDRAEIMREMRRLALTMGAHSIAKTFHARKIPSWQKKGRWDVARITMMLKSRMLIGEYQPRKGRKDFGEPVKNCYPPILSEQEFYALQSVLMTRTKVIKTRGAATVRNLFGAICTSGDDGSVMRVNNHDPKNSRFVSVDSLTGASANYVSFPYNAFENVFLKHVAELDMSGTTNADKLEIASLEGRLAVVRSKIDQIQAAGKNADSGKAYERVLKMVIDLEEQEVEIVEKLHYAKAKANRPQTTTADVAAIAAALENAPADEKVIGREKLKSAIQAVVESVKLFIRRDGKQRTSTTLCLALVTLRDGLTRIITIRTRKGETFSAAAAQPFKAEQLDAELWVMPDQPEVGSGWPD